MKNGARAGRLPMAGLFPLLLALALLGFALGLLLAWPEAGPAVPPAAPAPPVVPAPAGPVFVAAADAAAGAAAARREDATPSPAAPPRGFVQVVDDLVQLGMRTAAAATADDIDAAKAADAEARATFLDLMARFPDAGEQALQLLAGQPDRTDDPALGGRVVVLQLVLDEELARRAAPAATDRARLDALVEAVLGTMPVGLRAGEVGDRALHERPYLRATHEPAVLQLVRLAGDGAFPRPIATRMLLTLWSNLQRSGERSSEELSRLALLLLGDADPSQRLAACRQLLADPRYRALVVAWLREHADRAVANELAALAARELEPAVALAVLRELTPLLPQAPNAYLVLAFRAPETLADAYRELLASNTQPGVRQDLVTGVGMGGTPLGLEIAQLALANDPSPEVRIQAVFAITARGDADLAERAVHQLLDEPRIAQDPSRLGSLVLALQNLEAGGNANQLDRLVQRLRAMPLAEHSRQTLDALAQRSLPAGHTSVPAPR